MSIANDLIELNDNKSDIQDALVAKGVTSAEKHGFNKFAEDIANITNQYTSSDEGKVVDNGELVVQTAHAAITTNGTYDTTTNNSVTVNVASGNSECAVLYTDQDFTTPIDVYLIKKNNNFILCGYFPNNQVPTSLTTYYINPTDIDLSAFQSKRVTAHGYNVAGYDITVNGTIYGSVSHISLSASGNSSGLSLPCRFYGITAIT